MKVPSDQGLPALGLLCQGLMHLTLVLGTLLVLSRIAFISSGGDRLIAIAVLGVGFVRAALHHRVAERLRTRSPEVFAVATRYLWWSLALTALMLLGARLVLGTVGFEVPLALGFMGMHWPVTLWLLIHRRAVREAFSAADTFEASLVPADRSTEGAGVIMVSVAALGLVLLVVLVLQEWETLSDAAPAARLMLGLFLASLLARGVYHLRFGVRALGGLEPAAFDKAAGTYMVLGVTSAVLACVAALAVARLQLSLPVIGVALLLAYFLISWPLALRRFPTRPETELEAGLSAPDPLPHGPAPDRGKTALGYLLVALHSSVLTVALMSLVIVFSAWLGSSETPSLQWLDVATMLSASAGIWAGLELLRMSPNHRLAVMAYAGLALCTMLLDLLFGVGAKADTSPYLWGVAVMQGIMPVLALIILQRRHTLTEVTPPQGIRARAD